MPCGVVLTVKARLGAGGYDAWNFALADRLGMEPSRAIYLSAVVVIVVTAFIRRGRPRIATFLSSFFLGISTDFWNQIWRGIRAETAASMVFWFLTGMIIVAFGAASYMSGRFSPGPADDLVVALYERGLPIGGVKIVFDILCVCLAMMLGGQIGAGTIVLTLGLGPVIGLFHKYIIRTVTLLCEEGEKDETD